MATVGRARGPLIKRASQGQEANRDALLEHLGLTRDQLCGLSSNQGAVKSWVFLEPELMEFMETMIASTALSRTQFLRLLVLSASRDRRWRGVQSPDLTRTRRKISKRRS